MSELFGSPEFWVLVAAVVFVAVIWKRARQSVVSNLDARASRIRAELEAARRLREEAERALAEYQAKQREAGAEAEAIISHAKAEAERIAAQSLRELEDGLHRREVLAQERIAQEQAKAVAEIRTIAVDIAIAAARQAITTSLDENSRALLIDQAIAELPRELH